MIIDNNFIITFTQRNSKIRAYSRYFKNSLETKTNSSYLEIPLEPLVNLS